MKNSPLAIKSRFEHSMASRPSLPESSAQRIRHEILELKDVQAEVYRDAIYLGMTPEIARECDERRRRIDALTEELAALCSEPDS